MTKKELKNRYSYIVRAGYCDAYYLTNARNAHKEGAGSGIYGWNWSAYDIPSSSGVRVCICTGYRDLVGERMDDLVREYETRAKEADYTTRNQIAQEFADAVIERINKQEEEGKQ